MKKTLVIIPAYNEEGSIAKVIQTVKEVSPDIDVLVVNDCSTDKTKEIVKEADANIVTLPVNLGIGGAMQTGYLYAKENNYNYAIQVDGDGQHIPSEISKLLAGQEKTQADLVIGSRFLNETEYRSAIARRIGILLFSFVTKALVGQSIKDATSGFRLANRKVIDLFSKYYPTDYPEPEVIVYLKNKGLSIVEVPVKMKKREAGKSSITPFKSIYYMTKVIISMVMQKIRG